MITAISVGTKSYNLVSIPTSPGPTDIELQMVDSAAVFTSPFTGTEQVQAWPGADQWEATITLPPMTLAQSAAWEVFFGECRGRANVFQLGDARYRVPLAGAAGMGQVKTLAPAMTTTLVIGSWVGTVPIVGDYITVGGYRLYRILSSSTSGATTTFEVFPSIREPLSVSTIVSSSNPTGLFRLASNTRTVNWSVDRLSTLSLKVIEAR